MNNHDNWKLEDGYELRGQECSICEEVIKENAKDFNGNVICERCNEEKIEVCQCCGKKFEYDELDEMVFDEKICESCKENMISFKIENYLQQCASKICELDAKYFTKKDNNFAEEIVKILDKLIDKTEEFKEEIEKEYI